MEFEEEITENPFDKLKLKIKINRLLPSVLSVREVQTILTALYNKKKQASEDSFKYKTVIRDIAVIELLFATGIRVSELCNLKKENIDQDYSYIKILGKGLKERTIPITNPYTRKALEAYHLLYKIQINEKTYFFINRFNKCLSEQSVRFLVKNISQQIGINRNITPHVFRHTFATLLLEGDVDIRYIQGLLGHSSINITQIYTHVRSNKTLEILTLSNPRNLIAEINNN